ncbi:unnamed protein product [Brachionus calyciflorus]|uniref:HAT C-terminal dimerisation domain-containing protein n=1 Tax=Brachionus calyciflorus TaxID=104777 RepID=A0A813YNK5_9BILA|nr:unnamed protein product [Brachionus calyciflorus]
MTMSLKIETLNRRPLSIVSNTSDKSVLKSPKKRTKFLKFEKKNTSILPNEDEDLIFRNEKDQYLKIKYNSEVEKKKFWINNQINLLHLYRLALKYLSIPASTGPVERMFSSAGYFNRPHRSRITTKNLEITTLLKCNFDILLGN